MSEDHGRSFSRVGGPSSSSCEACGDMVNDFLAVAYDAAGGYLYAGGRRLLGRAHSTTAGLSSMLLLRPHMCTVLQFPCAADEFMAYICVIAPATAASMSRRLSALEATALTVTFLL